MDQERKKCGVICPAEEKIKGESCEWFIDKMDQTHLESAWQQGEFLLGVNKQISQ